MRKYLFLILFLSFSSIVFSQISAKNLSKEIKKAYLEKVKTLKEKVFFNQKSPTSKIKPVSVADLIKIQNIINKEDEIIDCINLNFLQAKKKIENDINLLTPSYFKEEISKFSEKSLLKIYDFKERIAKVNNFSEFEDFLKDTHFRLNILPFQMFISVKAYLTINKLMQDFNGEKILEELKYKIDNFENLNDYVKKISKLQYEILNPLIIEEKSIPSDFEITYTIRTREGLIVIYGKRDDIRKIKSIIEGVSYYEITQEKLIKIIKEMEPEINMEFFYLFKRRETYLKEMTLRSAIVQTELPIIEGLTKDEASSLLKKLGWKVYFLDELQNLNVEDIKNQHRKIVVLTGTSFEDKVIIKEE